MSVFAFWTTVTVLLGGAAQILVMPFDPFRKVAAGISRVTWGTCLFRGQPFWRLTITGLERVGRGPWVIVANHQSMLDIPLLMQLSVPVRIVARPGVRRMPVFGQMATVGGHVILDPDRVEEGIAHCKALLAEGVSIVLFPEGQRSDDRQLQPFSRGAFELALQTKVPILPVAITDTAAALPKGRPYGFDPISRIHLQVLEPVVLDAGRRALAVRVRDRIAEALAGAHPYTLAQTTMQRYRQQGRFRAGFAYGKVMFDPVFWMLRERLPRSGSLLDLGCGEGLLGAYLAAGGSRVSYRGVDIDSDRVSAATRAGLACDAGSILEVDFGDQDAVTCIDVLHYFSPEVQDALIARMCAALRPGGVLFIRDPERGRGLSSWWTALSERIFVAMGRHVGAGVRVRGGKALAAELRRQLNDVRIEDGSFGTPFANVLVSGRKPRGEEYG